MRLLLDTNAFLRWTEGVRVPHPVERVLTRQDTERFISIVTGWEVVMKPELGLSAAYVEIAIRDMGAALLPITFKHLNELSRLPFYQHHRDPFDRLLIAQALSEELALVSADTRFESYKRLRVIWD